jgi:hypothetical protein
MLLFIWAQPTPHFSGPAHARAVQAAASPPPMAADRLVPPVSAPLVSNTAAQHCCRDPPVSLSPSPSIRPVAHARYTSPAQSVSGRWWPGLPTSRQGPPCSCPAFSTRRPSFPTPTAPLPHPPPLKRESDDAVVPRALFPSSVPTLSTPQIGQPACCGLCREPLFSGAVGSVQIYRRLVKGYHVRGPPTGSIRRAYVDWHGKHTCCVGRVFPCRVYIDSNRCDSRI